MDLLGLSVIKQSGKLSDSFAFVNCLGREVRAHANGGLLCLSYAHQPKRIASRFLLCFSRVLNIQRLSASTPR